MSTCGTTDSSRRGNQLGLRHLMAWVLGCALGFAAYRGMMPPWPMPVKIRILSWAYNLAMGSAFGTILTGAGVLVYRRLRGDMSYPCLPGHWLLMFGLAAALADAVAVVVFRSLLAAWHASDTHLWAYWLPYHMARNRPDLAGMVQPVRRMGRGGRGRLGVLLAPAPTGAVELVRRVPRIPAHWGGPRSGVDQRHGHVVRPRRVGTRSGLVPKLDPPLRWAHPDRPRLTILVAIARDHWCRRPADGLHCAGVTAWLTVASIQAVTYMSLFSS